MSEGISYHVSAVLEAHNADKARRKMASFGSAVGQAAQRLQGAGQRIAGHTLVAASMMTSVAASAAAAAGAYGIGRMVVGGVQFNQQLEDAQMRTAAVLQLFDKGRTAGVGGPMLSMSEQFAQNMRVGQEAIDRLYTIAAKSPASFEETRQMFDNMLPGAVSVGASMEEIYDLTKKSLALGMMMGGDFQTTGGQMSRILTGGAGAEFETWKVLQVPILEAGKAMGLFNKSLEANSKLTERFNQLSQPQRLALVQAAVEKLGIVTEAYGETWAGVTSTIGSNLQMVQREIGRTAFGVIKSRLAAATRSGGAFDPEGMTQQRLLDAGRFFGTELGHAADVLTGKLIDGTVYVADHWQQIGDSLLRAFDTGKQVAELLLKFAAAKAIFGTGLQLAGGAVAAGSGVVDTVKGVGSALAGVGASSAYALPIVVVLGAALAGVGVAFAGVSAYFVENWERIMMGIQNGTITLGPLLDTFDVLWAQMVAIGEAFMGASDPAQQVNEIILFGTELMHLFGGAMVVFLQTAGVASIAIQGLIGVFGALYQAVLLMAAGFNQVILDLTAPLKDVPGFEALHSGMSDAQGALMRHLGDVDQFTRNQFDGESRFLDAATAAQNAIDNFDPEKGITAGMRERLKNFRDEEGMYGPHRLGPERPPVGSQASALAKKGNTTHIHKLIVNQDLRNHDPDRVVSAFAKAVDKAASKRVQANVLPEGGL